MEEEATSGSEYTPTDSEEEEEEQQEGRQADPLELRHLANRRGVDTSAAYPDSEEEERQQEKDRRMNTVEESDWEWDSSTGGVTARRSVTRAPPGIAARTRSRTQARSLLGWNRLEHGMATSIDDRNGQADHGDWF